MKPQKKKKTQGQTAIDAMKAIQRVLSGTEWNVDMLDTIADVLRIAGYEIKEFSDE